MKKTTKFLTFLTINLAIFSMLIMPVLSFAAPRIESGVDGGLVPCGRAVYGNKADGTPMTNRDRPDDDPKSKKYIEDLESITTRVINNKEGFSDADKQARLERETKNYNAYLDTDISKLVKNPCGFDDIMHLVNNVIHFILFDLAIPIVAIMFAYAGILLVTSGGDTGVRTKAKGVFLNAAIGLALMVGAWLIIRTILSILGYNGSWIFEGF